MIELKNINKYYLIKNKKFFALSNINLNIKKGELVALTGESGSGKSTLLNVIGLLDNFNSGIYYLENNHIKEKTQEELTILRNKYIGFIFQYFHLINSKSALDNVTLPLYYRKIDKNIRNEAGKEILDKVKLNDKYLNIPSELSGGQKQRVAIARALITKPKLLLADEPTGALDSNTSFEIINFIKSIHKEYNITIIIVTHDKEVEKSCERVIKLKDGKILN